VKRSPLISPFHFHLPCYNHVVEGVALQRMGRVIKGGRSTACAGEKSGTNSRRQPAIYNSSRRGAMAGEQQAKLWWRQGDLMTRHKRQRRQKGEQQTRRQLQRPERSLSRSAR
jgi:hypothetical protein